MCVHTHANTVCIVNFANSHLTLEYRIQWTKTFSVLYWVKNIKFIAKLSICHPTNLYHLDSMTVTTLLSFSTSVYQIDAATWNKYENCISTELPSNFVSLHNGYNKRLKIRTHTCFLFFMLLGTFVCCVFLRQGFSMCLSSYSGTCYVNQVGIKLIEIDGHSSAS